MLSAAKTSQEKGVWLSVAVPYQAAAKPLCQSVAIQFAPNNTCDHLVIFRKLIAIPLNRNFHQVKDRALVTIRKSVI